MSLDPEEIGLRPNHFPCLQFAQYTIYEIHVLFEHARRSLPAFQSPFVGPSDDTINGVH
jgi:hypothetical protein